VLIPQHFLCDDAFNANPSSPHPDLRLSKSEVVSHES